MKVCDAANHIMMEVGGATSRKIKVCGGTKSNSSNCIKDRRRCMELPVVCSWRWGSCQFMMKVCAVTKSTLSNFIR